ncbi:MAG: cyclic nucleotide-binding domain-containing protein [Pseudomonadota bacterium]
MSSINEEVAKLRRIPLFANVDPAKLKLLAFTSERVTFKPGQALFRQGEDGDRAYVIINGDADVIVAGAEGEQVVAQVEKNEFVGEIGVLCDTPRTATVRARAELVALAVTKDQLLTMLREFPDFALEMMRVLAERLAATTAELAATRASTQS